MKLYKVTIDATPEAENPTRGVAGWTTSDGDASKLCTAWKKADKMSDPKREAVEVPTTRAELVAFLNEYAAPAKAKGEAS